MVLHNDKITCCFVIPLYNHSDTLHSFHAQLKRELISNLPENVCCSILYIDDGSVDNTYSIASSFMSDPVVPTKVIRFTSNQGQVKALARGMEACQTDIAILRSADLQEPIAVSIAAITDHLQKGASVLCVREHRHDNLADRILSLAFYGAIKLFYPPMPLGGFDHVLLTRSVIEKLGTLNANTSFLQLDILSTGGPFSYIKYVREADPSRKSQWSLRKKIGYATLAMAQVISLTLNRVRSRVKNCRPN